MTITSLAHLEELVASGQARDEDFYQAQSLLADLERKSIEMRYARRRLENAERQAANYRRYVLKQVGVAVDLLPESGSCSFATQAESEEWGNIGMGLPRGDQERVRQ